MHFKDMMLGEVTLTISLNIFTNAFLENDLRGSNSYNFFILFGNDVWGSNINITTMQLPR